MTYYLTYFCCCVLCPRLGQCDLPILNGSRAHKPQELKAHGVGLFSKSAAKPGSCSVAGREQGVHALPFLYGMPEPGQHHVHSAKRYTSIPRHSMGLPYLPISWGGARVVKAYMVYMERLGFICSIPFPSSPASNPLLLTHRLVFMSQNIHVWNSSTVIHARSM